MRLWDVANEENYVLPLSSAGHGITRADQALSLAFNPIQRTLAVGAWGGVHGVAVHATCVRISTPPRADACATGVALPSPPSRVLHPRACRMQ